MFLLVFTYLFYKVFCDAREVKLHSFFYLERRKLLLKNLYLIVGPSGSGKTSLANKLEKTYGYKKVISCTTRTRREGEDEDAYHFLTDEEFDSLGKLVAYTVFDNNRYGVTEEMLLNANIYVIDPDGAKFLKENWQGKPIVTIGILATPKTCFFRMLERGDDLEKVKARIRHDKEMFRSLYGDSDILINGEKSLCEVAFEIAKEIELQERGAI